jgi:hypothetical protein
MRPTNEIIELLENDSQKIVNNISKESIDVYNFLITQYENSDVSANYLFQFVFRNFYRLDNAGLTSQFKTEYFNIMQEYRQLIEFDFTDILQRLFNIVNHQQQNTFQFSFVTKMQNTIDNNKPIYDNEVAKVFRFNRPRQGANFQDKLEFFLNQLMLISNTYSYIIVNHNLQNAIDLFDIRFQGNNMRPIKKLDFIFWSAGKLINN